MAESQRAMKPDPECLLYAFISVKFENDRTNDGAFNQTATTSVWERCTRKEHDGRGI